MIILCRGPGVFKEGNTLPPPLPPPHGYIINNCSVFTKLLLNISIFVHLKYSNVLSRCTSLGLYIVFFKGFYKQWFLGTLFRWICWANIKKKYTKGVMSTGFFILCFDAFFTFISFWHFSLMFFSSSFFSSVFFLSFDPFSFFFARPNVFSQEKRGTNSNKSDPS